jgi:AraC-type transcriptional regulator N-terminus
LFLHRESRPSPFQKWCSFGLSFTVVAQGRKVTTYRGVDLSYDPLRYLVVTGEAQFEGKVIEATPERPFLAFCYESPPDVVATTLLALADENAEPALEPVPAFVGALDAPMADCFVRLLRAVDDPLERKLIAPLVVQEIVFRLLRSDHA